MKILIIRFSSIGDIVLTTAVIRCIRARFPDAEIGFVTKTAFKEIAEANPNVNQVFSFSNDIAEVIPVLKEKKLKQTISTP